MRGVGVGGGECNEYWQPVAWFDSCISWPLNWLMFRCRIDVAMFDIQHDSPVPIHEQLTSQIRVHVASGALRAGAVLAEYRAFAQELLTNPQVVARAYAELEDEGVLEKNAAGGLVVTSRAAEKCRERMRNIAGEHLRRAVALGVACGLSDAEIVDEIGRASCRERV